MSSMRIVIEVTADGDGWQVEITHATPEGPRRQGRVMRRFPVPGGRHLPAPPDVTDAEVRDTVEALERLAGRRQEPEDLPTVGRWLFESLLGEAMWAPVRQAIIELRPDLVELALSWPAAEAELHRLPWEAMHDGHEYLAVCRSLAVAVSRLVPDRPARLHRIEDVPRVLFVIGTDLHDAAVRAGAEFMGLMRGLGGADTPVHARVLELASPSALEREVRAFRPDVVHFIGHGEPEPLTGAPALVIRPDAAPAAVAWSHHATAPELADRLLFDAADGSGPRYPAIVVLSACGTGGNPDARAGGSETAPLAASLVELGVPIIVGMAGRVSDSACRLFTRELALALLEGRPLVEAAARGRRAAYLAPGQSERAVDWALPTLHLTCSLDADVVPLVPSPRAAEVQRRIRDLDLEREPVFCGRREFFQEYERLVDPAAPRAVLVAYARGQLDDLGGDRLLRELAGQAIRDGHVPVLLGKQAKANAPKTPLQLGVSILEAIEKTRQVFRLGTPAAHLLQLLDPTWQAPPAGSKRLPDLAAVRSRIAAGLRSTASLDAGTVTEAVGAELHDLGAAAGGRRVIVLIHRVHAMDAAQDALLDVMLGPTGLGGGGDQVPVVLTAAFGEDGGDRARTAYEGTHRSASWIRYLELAPFMVGDEDELALRWILLHPRPRLAHDGEQYGYVYTSPARPGEFPLLHFRPVLKGLPGKVEREIHSLAWAMAGMGHLFRDDDETTVRTWARHVEAQG